MITHQYFNKIDLQNKLLSLLKGYDNITIYSHLGDVLDPLDFINYITEIEELFNIHIYDRDLISLPKKINIICILDMLDSKYGIHSDRLDKILRIKKIINNG